MTERTGDEHPCGGGAMPGERQCEAARSLCAERPRTEREAAEEAIRRSEARYRALVETSSQAVWNWDPATGAGDFDHTQRWWEAVTGQSSAEQGGVGWLEVVHPEDRERARAAWVGAMAAAEAYHVEYRIRARDGSYRHVIARAVPICGPDDSVREWVGTLRDITERRRAQAAQRESHQRLVSIVESVSDAFTSIDREWRVTYANGLVLQRAGLSAEAMLGRNIWELFPALLGSPAESAYREAMEGRKPVHFEVQGVRTGTWYETSVYPSPDGIVVFGRDITDRKQAEQAVRRSQDQIRLIMDAVPALISYIDADYCYWLVNNTYERWFGQPSGQIRGRHVREVLGEAAWEAVRPYMERALAGEEVTYEQELPYRVAGPRWVRATYTPDRSPDGRVHGFVVLVNDIAELKQAEAVLQEADRRKDEFIAMLAHELRNPLAPIRNSLHLLRLQGGDAEAVERLRAIMERQVGHMTRLIDDLLDVSRVSRGKIRLVRERLDLGQLVRVTGEAHQPAFHADGLTLEAVVPETPVWVLGDATRLTQVLDNLLENAHKFTDRGGRVTIRLRIADIGLRILDRGWDANDRRLITDHRSAAADDPESSLTAEGPAVRSPKSAIQNPQSAILSVTDTGLGIEPEMLGRLFDPFSQADRSLDRSRGGLGLGLALVKGLVALHGGSVEARSDGIGQGAEFVIRLPREAGPSALARLPDPSAPLAAGLPVLIAEDNPDTAVSLSMLLEAYGCAVTVACSGTEALAMARWTRPAIVLCDIGLPGMDGYAVARALRQEPELAAVRLIAITGYGQQEDLRRAREAGFDIHMVKPVDPEKLLALLRDSHLATERRSGGA